MHQDRFIASIKANEGLLYKIAALYTNHAEDRKDLLQEIVYQLWKSYPGFNNQSGISTWMYRVALNTAIYQLKLSKRSIPTVSIEENKPDHQDTGSQDQEDKWQAIKQQIDKLNLLDKAIVILYLEDKSHDEIAAVTGLSTSNVGTRLSRIKEKLKSKILKQS